MCGIAGFIAQSGRGKSFSAPDVLKCIEHRGPDDYGWLRCTRGTIERGREWTHPGVEPEVLFLHRRLSILDISRSGWQPMGTRDGRYYIVYNGEIYNYVELRKELEGLGHSFTSGSDTEVLLAAYAQWGIQALTRFVGMFAFALLDTQRQTVLLARDFFGIKPLYYCSQDGFFCFGSEIKALLKFGFPRLQGNAERLLLYLRYGLTDFGSQTLLSRVQQLPAGHYLELSVGDRAEANEPQCYWSLVPGKDDELEISFDEAAAHLRELFLRNVSLHLRSDVPLGSALSGGVDSSSIVMATRHLDSKAEIHAFSFIAEDHDISEERWIDIVARESGAHIHKVRASAVDLVADLDAMMHFHDEPFGSTSAYAQYQVFRAAREAGIKVMLDGQGADEILGGYRCYLGARLASLLRQNRWRDAVQLIQSFSRLDGFGRFQGLAYCADYLLPPSLQSTARKLTGKDTIPAWLNHRWFADRGIDPRFLNYTTEKNVLRDSLARSVSDTLPGLLRYEDRNSMAASVESRVPFLTPELVSFLCRLPEEYIIAPDGTSKAVFRKAMRGIVPDAILDRRDKLGFVTPEARWLKLLDGWVRKVLGSDTAHQVPFLNLSVVRREWDSISKGTCRLDFRVWRWLNLILWTQELGVIYN
jgi:asparagine synthase (glutamine-hydrolysing)